MSRMSSLGIVRVSVGVGLLGLLALEQPANAQTMLERSAEARFQLDLEVPYDALTSFLPSGWDPNVSTQGNAKDANLRAIFIDRVTINDPEGQPVGVSGSTRLVYLVAPVTDPSGANVQLVIGGLTADPADAPGPFGNYLLATEHSMQRSSKTEGGLILDTQDWVFTAPSGENLEMHIVFERGVGNRRDSRDIRYYSAETPDFYQISRQEQVLEVLRNVTTTPRDRAREFSFSASGGRYAELFDGTHRVLSWDNIPWINRSVLVP